MNVAMFTNTYFPEVGGLAVSVERFSEGLRERGHSVLVVAPEYDASTSARNDVIRVPAIQHEGKTWLTMPLSLAADLHEALDAFQPDIAHAHHPYLLGDTALRVGAERNIPVVLTHHTSIREYYAAHHLSWLREYVLPVSVGHANLCDAVVAPSESVAAELRRRGVTSPIAVVPTGVDTNRLAEGDGTKTLRRLSIPADAFVIGYVGRLSPEKNLDFLCRALVEGMKRRDDWIFLAVGAGERAEMVEQAFGEEGKEDRLRLAGTLEGQDLVDAYHAMDVFAFASTAETQAMVVTEAWAAGVPVVALEGPGVREAVQDGYNGRLLQSDDPKTFSEAVQWVADLDASARSTLSGQAQRSAEPYEMSSSVEKLLGTYRMAVRRRRRRSRTSLRIGASIWRQIKRDAAVWANRIKGLFGVLTGFTKRLPRKREAREPSAKGDDPARDGKHMSSRKIATYR